MNTPAPRILCVDDQAEASSLLVRHLGAEFACTVARDADDALGVLEREGPFAVVVSDFVMPGTNGVELFKRIKARWPDTVRVMVTALDDLDVAIAALHDGSVYRFVRKPWQQDEILHAVREAADYHHLIVSERRLREQLARTNAELDERLRDLDEANELLEYWVEFSPAVLYSFSFEDGVLRASYISKNFARLSGYERTTAVIDADFWPGLIEPAERARYQQCLDDLASGERSHAVLEYRIRHRAGTTLTIVDSLRAVHDGDGRTIELVGAWMDVTARR